MTAYETLQQQAAQHTAYFMEDATPATTRQIGFLSWVIKRNSHRVEDMLADIEHYNGGHKWGLDKACASLLIRSYATKQDFAEKRGR